MSHSWGLCTLGEVNVPIVTCGFYEETFAQQDTGERGGGRQQRTGGAEAAEEREEKGQ